MLAWEEELGTSTVDSTCSPEEDQACRQVCWPGSLSLVCLQISAVTPRVFGNLPFSSHMFFLLKILSVSVSKNKRKKMPGGG